MLSGDSIFPAKTYACHVFPFWKNHTIGKERLVRSGSDQDSAYYFNKDTTYPNFALEVWVESLVKYKQNIGLFSDTFKSGTSEFKFITLQSYNNKDLSVGHYNILKKGNNEKCSDYFQLFYTAHDNHRMKNEVFFSLNGKTIIFKNNTTFIIGIRKIER